MPTTGKLRTTIAGLAIALGLFTTAAPAQAFWPIGARIAAALVVPHLIASVVNAARALSCPPYAEGYRPGPYESPSYAPSYGPAYAPGYAPTYAPSYGAAYAPSYGPGYAPGYAPAYGQAYSPRYWPASPPSYGPTYAPRYRPVYPPYAIAAPRGSFGRAWVPRPRPRWDATSTMFSGRCITCSWHAIWIRICTWRTRSSRNRLMQGRSARWWSEKRTLPV